MIQIQTWKKMESNMSPAHWNLVIIQISLLKQEPLSNGLFTLKKAVLTAATIRFCCQILIPNVFLKKATIQLNLHLKKLVSIPIAVGWA